MKVIQSCSTLCDPVDCSPPGSSVYEILQARLLEWVAIPFKESSQPRDQTQVSCIAGRLFTVWATRETHVATRLQCFNVTSKKYKFTDVAHIVFLLDSASLDPAQYRM